MPFYFINLLPTSLLHKSLTDIVIVHIYTTHKRAVHDKISRSREDLKNKFFQKSSESPLRRAVRNQGARASSGGVSCVSAEGDRLMCVCVCVCVCVWRVRVGGYVIERERVRVRERESEPEREREREGVLLGIATSNAGDTAVNESHRLV